MTNLIQPRVAGRIVAAALCAAVLGALSMSSVHAQTPPAIPPGTPAPLDGAWSVDPVHTDITFAVSHFGLGTVRGRFDDVAGSILAYRAHPEKSSVTITIQTASVDTNVKMRDDDLRSPAYFDATKYPTITFASTKIAKANPKLYPGAQFVAFGNLTIKGVTKPVVLPFTLSGPIHDPFGGVRFGVDTEVHISRLDYGVGGNQSFVNGAGILGKVVDVQIGLEAVPAKKG